MFKKLLLAASLAPAVLAAPFSLEPRQSTKIVFDKSALELHDADFGGEIAVSLSEEPTSGVATVYLEAPGLQLTRCSLRFTKNDWRQPQRVRLLAGGSDKTTKYTLNAQVFSPNSGVHNAKASVAVTRVARSAATCYSTGDPHYKTFDGRYYSAQDTGVFYLVRAPTFAVQVNQQPCNRGVTCNQAVAIQYGSSVVMLTAAPRSRTALDLKAMTAKTDGIKVTANAAKSSYQLALPDGTQITANIHPWAGVYYIDVFVNAAGAHFGRANGLCGNFNGRTNDDTTPTTSVRVADAENFFQGKSLSITIPVPPATSACKMPDLGGAQPGDGAANTDPKGMTSLPISVPSPTVISDYINSVLEFSAAAQQAATQPASSIPASVAPQFCNGLRQGLDAWCAANVDVDYFVGACTADLANTGEMGVVENHKKNLMTACAAKAAVEGRFASDSAQATQLLDKAGDLFAAIAGAVQQQQQQQAAPAPAPVNVPAVGGGSWGGIPSMPAINAPAINVPAMNVPSMNVPAMNIPAMNAPAVNIPSFNMPNFKW
ncbi:hypothetical protein HDU96_008256 [Phlyctochytrium bullatum]|nr:hypothetical protein HDU96_008256 [Phlyctochytrium bullatum]